MYKLEWLVEGRVVLMQGIGNQTIVDLQAGVEQLFEMLTAGDAPVHILSDSRYIGKFPTRITAVKYLLKHHEKSGHTVLIGGSALIKFISIMFNKMSSGRDPLFAETIVDAIEILQRIDATLPKDVSYEERPVG